MIGKRDYYDYHLLVVIILLTAFGLVILYSTTSHAAEITYGNDMYFFRKQAFISIVAIAGAVAVSFFDYHLLAKLAGLIYLASLILMALVHTPLGFGSHGARRWLAIGPIQFQPAEIAKIAVILFVPLIIVKMGKRFHTVRGALFPLVIGLIPGGCAYFLTSNLSTAIIIVLITWFVVFIAHRRSVPFAVVMILAVGAVILFVWALVHNGATVDGSFRIRRVLVWLSPEQYPDDGGYQIMQALYALGSGGLFGKGLGNSAQKLGPLPEAQNDMIFSIVCEELGVFGGILLILLFAYLLYRLFFIAQNAPDLYGTLIVTGVFVHVALQVVLNISVVINLIPTTGITLPFVSYGGTSILLLLFEMAIALSVSGQIRFRTETDKVWGDVKRRALR